MDAMSAPTVEQWSTEAVRAYRRQQFGASDPDAGGDQTPAPSAFNRDDARLAVRVLRLEPPPPAFVVQGYLPRDVTTFVAPGSTGKSTVLLQEAVHLALDRHLYGQRVVQPGATLIVTAEDARSVYEYRLHHMARQLGLTDAQQQRLADHIFIEDVVGKDVRLVIGGPYDTLTISPHVQDLVLAYEGTGLAQVIIDPLVSFGPGERYVNDGLQRVIEAGRVLSRRLGCAVRLVHHTTIETARLGTVDQYSGRGGAALADGVRAQHQLVCCRERGKDCQPPSTVEVWMLADGRVFALHINKLSHAPRPRRPFWLVRQGFVFKHHPWTEPETEAAAQQRDERDRANLEQVQGFLRAGLLRTPPVRYSRSTLELEYKHLGLGRNDLRALIQRETQTGGLEERELPKSERRGALKAYLAPGRPQERQRPMTEAADAPPYPAE